MTEEQKQLEISIRQNNINKINELLSINPDLANSRFDNGDTPLYRALMNNYLEIASLLLEKEVDPNIPDNHGNTPLLLALMSNNLEIASLLLENGANPNIPDNNGNTPFFNALYFNKLEILNLLFKHGVTFEDDRTFNKVIKICLTKTNGAEAKDCVNAVFSRFDLTDLNKILNFFDNNPYASSDKKHDLLKVFFNNFNLDFPSYNELQDFLNKPEHLNHVKEALKDLDPNVAKAFLYEFDNGFYNTCNLTREQFINTFVTNGLSKIITFDPDKHYGPATEQILNNTDLMTEIFSYFKFPNSNSIETDLFGDYPADNTDLL